MTGIDVASIVVRLAAGYLAVGAVFGVWFAAAGAGRLDPVAANGSAGFRLLVFPGAMTLWPVLLWKSVRGRPPMPAPDNAS